MGAKESEVAKIPTLTQRMRKARGTRRRNDVTVEIKRRGDRPGDERGEGGGKWVVRIRRCDRGVFTNSPISAPTRIAALQAQMPSSRCNDNRDTGKPCFREMRRVHTSYTQSDHLQSGA